jgi:hypothetical protein
MTTKSEPQAYALGVGCLTLGYLTERPGVSGDGEAAQPVLMHFHGKSAPGKLNSPLVPVSYPLVSGRKTGPAAWRCSPQTTPSALIFPTIDCSTPPAVKEIEVHGEPTDAASQVFESKQEALDA